MIRSNQIKKILLYWIFITGPLLVFSLWPGTGRDDYTRFHGHRVRDISKLLEKQRSLHGLPAVAAAVIKKDQVVAVGAAGTRIINDPVPATTYDRWHLGSCTKAFTATMIGVLVEQERLSWDTTIAEALPRLYHKMRPEYRNVTLEMLLSNRGGIRHEWDVPGLWEKLWRREGSPGEERRKMAEIMLRQPPKVKPGRYFYSNCGFAIAGHMAETVTRKPWEELVRELVFQPLGMHTAGFGVPWVGKPPTDPWPHHADGKPLSPGMFADNPPSIGPGATIHASIGDWSKFIIEHLKGARSEDGFLLKAATYRRLHRPRPTRNKKLKYALGWMVIYKSWAKGKKRYHKGKCLHHAGTNNSWFALAWIMPERDFAVIVTTNIGGQSIFKKFDKVCWAVIQQQLKRTDDDLLF